MKNDIVELISVSASQDADGFPVKTEYRMSVFADVQSAKRNEFYQAANAGYEVRLVCVVNEDDYNVIKQSHGRPTLVDYDGDVYKILKFYKDKKKHSIELTLIEGD